MKAQQKTKADAAIYARREQEMKTQKLTQDIAAQKNLTLTAQWEHKTDNMINKRIVSNRIQEIRGRYVANLE